MENNCLLIDKLRQEVISGQITCDAIIKRLSVAIENEYLKDTPNMDFINVCEDFLWEIGTQGRQEYISSNQQYLEAIHLHTESLPLNTNSFSFGQRLTVILVVFAFLIFFTQDMLSFDWFTQESNPDGQQYIIQGHEITISLIQKCIAEHDASSELKTNNWEELCDYLGFAPSVISPEAFQVDVALYQAYVEPGIVMVNALYESEPGDAIAVLTLHYYTDLDEALFMFEQDAVGEKVSLCNHTVYTSTNLDHISYSWISDSTVSFLTGIFSPDVGLTIVEQLIGGTSHE